MALEGIGIALVGIFFILILGTLFWIGMENAALYWERRTQWINFIFFILSLSIGLFFIIVGIIVTVFV